MTTAPAVALTHRLSTTQRKFLASRSRSGGAPVQSMTHLVHIDGSIDPDRLAAAFEQVVRSSDILRTQIPSGEKAVVAADIARRVEVVRLDIEQVDAWAAMRAANPLDLTVSAWDSVVLDHGSEQVTWYLNLDHLVTDATTTAAIVSATGAAYEGETLDIPSWYGWVRRTQARNERGTRLPASAGGLPSQLYTSAKPGIATSSRHTLVADDQFESQVRDALGSRLRLLGDELSWTALLVASTALWVHQLTARSEVTLGVPVHHRTSDEAAQLFGPLVDLHPVTITIDPTETASRFHKRVSRALLSMLADAQSGAEPSSDFDVVVNIIPNSGDADFGGRALVIDWLAPQAIDPAHVARIQLTGYGQGLKIDMDINHGASNAEHRDRAPAHFRAAMLHLVESPESMIGDADLLTENERHILDRWESGGPGFDDHEWVGAALRERLRTNDDVVVHDPAGDLTGRELWAWASNVGRHLRSRGVRPGDRVSVELDPSVQSLAAIYGIVAAGCSFVPLDPSQPASRRSELAAVAQCRVRFDQLSALDSLRTVEPSLEDGELADSQLEDGQLASEAYLLFTSGSTGTPKGVPILHHGLASYVRFALESYFDAGVPTAPLYTSLGFDLTITTIFAPILAGGRLVMPGAGAPALPRIAADDRITWIKATPSHLEILTRLLPSGSALATAVVGGESFPSRLARRLMDSQPSLTLFNEYGPTEAVVGCMIHQAAPDELTANSEVSIGGPAPGVQLRIATATGGRVPVGAVGELLISHAGVTTGYIGAQDQPDQPFVEIDGSRWYRSGDLVRLRNDDLCDFLGRVDTQLKVGGRRLDPIEVEDALAAHPAVDRAAVRLHQPQRLTPSQYCARCGLPDTVPGASFDDEDVCATCRSYEAVAPAAAGYFGTPDDLAALLEQSRSRSGEYDCLHLLSGGKDSTYALYQLVELGYRPYVLTLDNGYISDGAKQNIRRTVAHLGLDHEFASTPHMDEIFRDSLATYSNVCNGCYKTIYILATRRAAELGIGAIVTGLSRGQLFETRLLPAQFRGSVDPDEIDRSVLRARMRYHRAPDLPNQLLGSEIFERDELFEEIEYLDFYRYTDVELSEMLEYLGTKTAWERPADTGRSTNCLINIAGIHTHQLEQGYHNYAIPYAWDVRLGHKTRDEAIAELDDDPELDAVARLLGEVGYTPSPSQTLTAWVEPVDGAVMPSGTELRAWLSSRIAPWAIPAAFVVVEELPTTTNGKLDESRLPPPERVHRPGVEAILAPTTATEEAILHIWERVLNLEPIGIDDDFFALGGDSLAALTALAELADVLDRDIPDELGFIHTTAGELGAAVDHLDSDAPVTQGATPDVPLRQTSIAPQLTAAEAGVLFEQRQRPDQVMYNLGRRFSVAGVVSTERWLGALEAVVAHEATLSWTYGSPRLPIDTSRQIDAAVADDVVSAAEAVDRIAQAHRVPFDLDHGPLLRCVVQPVDDGTTEIALIIHHACGDRTSLDLLFARAQQTMTTQVAPPREHDYADVWAAQRATEDRDRAFWINDGTNLPVAGPSFETASDDDGLLTRVATAGVADLLSVRGAAATTIVTAAAARAVAPAFADGRVELALLSSARTIPEATDCFGYFLNPLPLVVTASGSDPDADDHAVTLTETARQLGRKLAHRSYPFPSIVADRRDAGLHVPDGRVLVAWDEGSTLTCDGHDVTASALFNGSAVTDLTLFAEVRGDELALSIEYNGTKVGRRAADDILARFDIAITEMIGAAPRIGSAAVIERTRSVISGPALATNDSVHSRLVRRLAAASSSPAVTVDGVTWSDADLASRVDGIAAQLRECGVVAGDRVAVMLPRGHDLVAAMLATQVLGAAYVPIDPEYPMRRRVAVVQQANARCVIARPDVAENLGAPVIDPNTAVPAQAEFADLEVDPNREAYVIFTSGSTGEPRGVAVTSAQLDASTNARRQVYEHAPTSFLLLSSAAFDSSIVGLFWTLAEGGELVIPTDDQAHDVDRLCAVIETAAPTHVLCVPTLYRALLTRRVGQAWPTQVIVAGEACDSALVQLHFETVPDSVLTNEYGPTEATVWATAHHCRPDDEPVPIGNPIPGTWVAVVTPDGSIAGAGESGELVIGGAGVTNGYVNDPEETARRFGSDLTEGLVGPYFRTGDLVRTQGNTVYFLGRLDEQLNLGGLRVEPGEIEAALVAVPGVAAAIAGAVDARSLEELVAHASDDELRTAFLQSSESDDPRHALRSALLSRGEPDLLIAAWLEAPDGIDEADLKRTVEDHLGPLVRPRRWIAVAELPRLPNGKIDRAAAMRIELPLQQTALVGSPSASGNNLDGNDAVAEVCEVFASVLRVDAVGPDDSFFDLGGHSLLALELLGAVEARFGTRLSTTVIFTDGTPRGIAAHLGTTSRSMAGSAHQLVIPIQTEGARPPIFAINNLGTNGEYFRPLSAELGSDQPIYGLGSGERFDMYGVASYDPDSEVSVEEIAARCVQSIEELAPDGPVVLAGLCGGAIHAYEVAQQLTARGRTVASFIMINDWQAPRLGGDLNHSPQENLRRRLNNLVTLRGEYLPWIYGPLKRRAELLELQVVTRFGRPLSHRQRVRKYIEESVASMNNYDYLPYDGPATVLRGRDDPRLAGQEGVGWQGLLTDVVYEPIDAIGIDLLMSDAVTQTAAAFKAAIDRGLQTVTNSRSSSSSG